MNRTFSRFAVGIAFLAALAGRSLPAQDDYIVTAVKFTGNRHFSSGELSRQITTYSTSGFQRSILRKEAFRFSEEILQSDVQRLLRFYQSEGFLNARLAEPQLKIDQPAEKIEITLRISEGEPQRVDSVEIQVSADSVSSANLPRETFEKMHAALTLTNGARFRDDDLRSDQLAMIDLLNNSGYPYAKADYELVLRRPENAVQISWFIQSGPRSVFGNVTVQGNNYISSNFIHDQLRFKAGQTYNARALQKSQENIYSQGFFQFVTLKAGLAETRSDSIPIEIQLKEAPRFTTRFGVGYGDEEKFRGFITLRWLGYWLGARRITLFAKYSALEPVNLNLSTYRPTIFTPNTSMMLSLFVLRQNEPGYDVQRIGGSITLEQRFSNVFSGHISYILEKVNNDTTDISLTTRTTEDSIDNLYNKSYPVIGIEFNNSRPLFSPRQGSYAALSVSLPGFDIIPSTYQFTKIGIDLRRYGKFVIGSILATRLKSGFIFPRNIEDFIPVEERFYAGGSNSVRGWARSELGPLGQDGKPLGGNSLLEGSAEVRFPIWKILGGAVFLDFGNVWEQTFFYRLDEIRYSNGLGLRMETPVGPVRLDVAWPIDTGKKTLQFHISVGQAF